MAREHFSVPPDRGALWTGIGAQTATSLAMARHLTTLEMTPLGASLDRGAMKQEMIRDFGENWIAEKREIFKAASARFAESLLGLVTVFLPQGISRPRDGAEGSFAYNVKIIWDELRDADFGDPRRLIQKITAMRICWVDGGRVVSETFMSASNQIH